MKRIVTNHRMLPFFALLIGLVGPLGGANAQGTLRYVSAGVSQTPKLPASQQLQFAHKDALDLARVWQKQKGKLYANVEGVALTNEHATRQGILKALDRLSAEAKAGDVAMIALCGHGGGIGVRGEWGFVPYDFDDGNAAGTALTATDLRARLNEIARRGITVVLILDCCHAGAFAAVNCDFVVFAACLPQEFSHESAAWNNGLYTMALVEAFDGKADFNGDGVVTLAETDAYVTSRVAQMLRDRAVGADPREAQNPSCGRPTNIRGNLPLTKLEGR